MRESREAIPDERGAATIVGVLAAGLWVTQHWHTVTMRVAVTTCHPGPGPPHDAGHGSSGGGAGVEQLQVVMMRPLNIVNTCHTIVHQGAEFIR